ncbi:MAG: sulfatase-like hydrolase/transferase [Limisphaerales bacterium]
MKFPTLVLALLSFAALTHAATRPNFVFIQGEGQGWTSLSIEMDANEPRSKSDFFYTPNLARLAEEGMRFSRFYAPSPRCTPSRAAYFTGKSPGQLHMTYINSSPLTGRVNLPRTSTELPLSEITIAEHLKTVGYATAHFGKWHVGRASPSQHGFDENDGPTANNGPGRNSNPNPQEAYGTATRAIDFMTRQTRAGKPFFLQISQYPGRSALNAKPETMEAMRQRVGRRDDRFIGAAAVALDVDINVGRVLDAIDQLGIKGSTYVYYTTDHGTPGRNGLLSYGKGSVKEGGLRVPMIFRGPGIQAGTFANTLTHGMDLFPTIAELAGVKSPLPAGVEGGSFASILRHAGKGSVERPGEEFVAHFPHYDGDPNGPCTAIYDGDFKLIRSYESGNRYLYNLRTDIGERNDLSKQMPAKVAELDRRMSAHLKLIGAQVPAVDMSQPAPSGEARRGDRPQGAGGGKGGQRGGGGGNRPNPILTALDTDKDGKLTPREMQNAATVLLKFDTNRDGKVTLEEIRRANRPGGGEGGRPKRSR